MSNNLDKISWELVEVIKDMTKKNITTAVTTNQLNVDRDALSKLFSLIDSSMTEAYNKSHKNISRKFEKVIKETAYNDTVLLKKRK